MVMAMSDGASDWRFAKVCTGGVTLTGGKKSRNEKQKNELETVVHHSYTRR